MWSTCDIPSMIVMSCIMHAFCVGHLGFVRSVAFMSFCIPHRADTGRISVAPEWIVRRMSWSCRVGLILSHLAHYDPTADSDHPKHPRRTSNTRQPPSIPFSPTDSRTYNPQSSTNIMHSVPSIRRSSPIVHSPPKAPCKLSNDKTSAAYQALPTLRPRPGLRSTRKTPFRFTQDIDGHIATAITVRLRSKRSVCPKSPCVSLNRLRKGQCALHAYLGLSLTTHDDIAHHHNRLHHMVVRTTQGAGYLDACEILP